VSRRHPPCRDKFILIWTTTKSSKDTDSRLFPLSSLSLFLSLFLSFFLSLSLFISIYPPLHNSKHSSREEAVKQLATTMFDFCQKSRRDRILMRNQLEESIGKLLDWQVLESNYSTARKMALDRDFQWGLSITRMFFFFFFFFFCCWNQYWLCFCVCVVASWNNKRIVFLSTKMKFSKKNVNAK
jgi:hypothetical protein